MYEDQFRDLIYLHKNIKADAERMWLEMGQYFQSQKISINEIIFVPFTIFSRIVRLSESVAILNTKNFVSESLILLTSQFEAKLDLGQACRVSGWATKWVEHKSTKVSVDRIKSAILSVYPNEDSRNTENSIYELLSIVKHGNPVGSEIAFPTRINQNVVTVATGPVEDQLTDTLKIACQRYANHQLAWSAELIRTTITKYAICNNETQKAVKENFLKVSAFNRDFESVVESLIRGSSGHLDLPNRSQS